MQNNGERSESCRWKRCDRKGGAKKQSPAIYNIHPKTVRRYRNNPSARLERTWWKRHLLDAYKPTCCSARTKAATTPPSCIEKFNHKGIAGISPLAGFRATLRAAGGLPACVQKTNEDHKLPADLVPTAPTPADAHLVDPQTSRRPSSERRTSSGANYGRTAQADRNGFTCQSVYSTDPRTAGRPIDSLAGLS